MAIQGIEVPMYTYTHCFCIFQFLIFILKNKIKQNWKLTKQKMLNKTKQYIKLDWLKTIKQNTQVMQKQKQEGEREKKWHNHLEPFSFYTLEEPFRLENLWSGGEGEELKPLKFKRNMGALRRSPRGEKDDGSWFWSPDAITLLLFWVANHL